MSEWQPIETAPKDGTPILLYVPDEIDQDNYEKPPQMARHVAIGWSGRLGDRSRDGVWCAAITKSESFNGSELTGSWMEHEWLQVGPTHWMPLPEPPNTPTR